MARLAVLRTRDVLRPGEDLAALGRAQRLVVAPVANMMPMTRAVGVYARISDDKDLSAAGVGRQVEDCQSLAERRGESVAEIYEDNDVSAYKRNVRRPAFERILKDLEAGRISGVVVYDLDRLARQPRDLERLVTLYETRHGLSFATVTGDYDLSDPNGLFMARTMVNMANKSSADTARRVKRKHLENAQRGIPVGGTRPFGWQADKRTLDPVEAAVLRQAVADVLAGKPLASVVVEWQDQGLKTTKGNEWTRTSLLKTLTNPRLAGFSARNVQTVNDQGRPVVRREIVLDPDGKPVVGVWQPIISPEDFDSLCAVLTVKRPRPGTGGTITKYLFSGLCRCGKCGKPMRGLPRSRVNGPDTFQYVCQGRAAGGCGGVSRDGRRVDEFLTTALLAKMRQESERASTALTSEPVPWDGLGEMQDAQESVQILSKALASGRVTPALIDALDAQERRVKRLERQRAEYLAAKAEAEAVPVQMTREEFEALPLPTRRKYAEDRLAAVIIQPMPDDKKRRGVFLPDLLQPVWR